MAEFTCTEADGWSGIGAALGRARPGDRVRISAGVFEGSETLLVPSGVRLVGAGTLLRFAGDRPALLVDDAVDVTIGDLSIEMTAETVRLRRYHEDPAPDDGRAEDVAPEWGAVLLRRSQRVILERIVVKSTAAPAGLNGIVARLCRSTRIEGCTVIRPGRDGIASMSSEVDVIDCLVGSSLKGITLVRSHATPEEPSRGRIVSNRSHDNTEAGIVLFSSESDAIEANETWGNGLSGIILERDEKSPDAPSRGRIVSNRCHDNEGCGIVLFSSESKAIEANETWSNGNAGIALARDGRSQEVPSRGRIVSNRCHSNREFGIALWSSESEAIEANEAWGNGRSGIALARDERSPEAPSRGRIVSNRCHDNTHAGIILYSSESEGIEANESWANRAHGILLRRDECSPDVPSRSRIISNRCHDNAYDGIVLYSSESEGIEANESWGNGAGGITLARLDESPKALSRGRIVSNRCHNNKGFGIVLFSSESEAIEANETWGNGFSGIALARFDESPEEPSRGRIVSNRSHDNTYAGIILYSSESEVIEANETWGNGRSGIALVRGKKSPKAPSNSRVVSNRCHHNTQDGIIFFSSESEAIEANETWGNGTSGIALGRDERSPEAPSRGRIVRNTCNDNRGSAFDLLGEEVIEFIGNRAWGNGAPSLIPRPGSGDRTTPWTPATTALSGTADPDAPGRRRRASGTSDMADRLDAERTSRSDEIAAFVAGPGCPHCLAAAFGDGRVASAPVDVPQTTPTMPNGAVISTPRQEPSSKIDDGSPGPATGICHRLVSTTEGRFEFGARESSTLADVIWRHVRNRLHARAANTLVIGILGGDPKRELALLREEFDHLVQGGDVTAPGRSPGSAGLLGLEHALSAEHRTVGRFLTVDCAARSASAIADATPDFPLFQEELCRDSGTFSSRVPFLLSVRGLALCIGAFAGLIALLAAFGYAHHPDSADGVFASVSAYIIDTFKNANLHDWKTVLGIPAFCIILPLYLLDIFVLPKRIRFTRARWIGRGVLEFLSDVSVKLYGLEKLLVPGDDRKPAKRWITRHLFGGWGDTRGFSVLGLVEPDAWSPDDLARLRETIEARPSDQTMIVVVPLRSSAQIASGLLSPWFDGEAHSLRRSDVEVRILALPVSDVAASSGSTALDVEGLFGEETGTDPQTVWEALQDDRLTPCDLVPLMVLASTDECPFSIEIDSQDMEGSLRGFLEPYGRLFADDPNTPLPPFAARDVERRMMRSPATLICRKRVGTRTRRVLIGRPGFSEEVRAALTRGFGGDIAARDAYERKIALCGEYAGLTTVLASIEGGEIPSALIERLARALAAAREMRRRRGGHRSADHRSLLLEETWKAVVGALRTAKAPPAMNADDEHRLETIFGLLSDVEDARFDHMSEDDWAKYVIDGLGAEAGTIGHAFACGLDRTLTALAELSPQFGQHLLNRSLSGRWRAFSPALQNALRRRFNAKLKRLPSFVDRLVAVDDSSRFTDLLKAHAEVMPTMTTLCLCLAARCATTGEERNAVADLIVQLRAAGAAIDPKVVVAAPSKVAPNLLKMVLSETFMREVTQSRPDIKIVDDEQAHIYLGTFDPINTIVNRIVAISLH